jgi:hypothetical protein
MASNERTLRINISATDLDLLGALKRLSSNERSKYFNQKPGRIALDLLTQWLANGAEPPVLKGSEDFPRALHKDTLNVRFDPSNLDLSRVTALQFENQKYQPFIRTRIIQTTQDMAFIALSAILSAELNLLPGESTTHFPVGGSSTENDGKKIRGKAKSK